MADKLNLLQVVGARPQIIKSAAIDRAIKNSFLHDISLTTVHTGQHYDHGMSEVFYSEMDISVPDINLNIGSGSHAIQTASIITACESTFTLQRPDCVLVYGDTNSTLAAALAAYKLNIPVLHIEAGLRSFNLEMPEECNRIATDHLSTMLFCPTQAALDCLKKEGLLPINGPYSLENPGVILSGDVMYDNSLFYAKKEENNTIVQGIDLSQEKFILATCHRPVNTDDKDTFRGIIRTLAEISEQSAPVILPVHPRLLKHDDVLAEYRYLDWLHLIEPVSFLEMIRLESRCELIITDSGGVQKEAFFFQKPCIVMRDQTEWTELVSNGNADLCGNDPVKIKSALNDLLSRQMDFPEYYGNGDSASGIVQSILDARLC